MLPRPLTFLLPAIHTPTQLFIASDVILLPQQPTINSAVVDGRHSYFHKLYMNINISHRCRELLSGEMTEDLIRSVTRNTSFKWPVIVFRENTPFFSAKRSVQTCKPTPHAVAKSTQLPRLIKLHTFILPFTNMMAPFCQILEVEIREENSTSEFSFKY